METPTEDQLRYYATRYAILGNAKWYKFLIRSFPTEENIKFVTDTACNRFQNNIAYYDAIRSLLVARPLTEAHLDLASKYGGRSTRRKVIRIRKKICVALNYEI